jgi:hypothetical protein
MHRGELLPSNISDSILAFWPTDAGAFESFVDFKKKDLILDGSLKYLF